MPSTPQFLNRAQDLANVIVRREETCGGEVWKRRLAASGDAWSQEDLRDFTAAGWRRVEVEPGLASLRIGYILPRANSETRQPKQERRRRE
jgi:hypothetical protein